LAVVARSPIAVLRSNFSAMASSWRRAYAWVSAIVAGAVCTCLPEVSKRALDGLKFSEALPERLAVATLAARLADVRGAERVLDEPTRFISVA
jgi:hypothetical protein